MKRSPILTQSQVNSFLAKFDGSRRAIGDGQVIGLQLEVISLLRGKWRFRYYGPSGSRRCLTIGDAPTLNLQQARSIARDLHYKVAQGLDPTPNASTDPEVPTFEEFVERQYLPYVKTYKRSWKTDMSLLTNHLYPRFARSYLDKITREDIQRMHSERRQAGAAPATANRLLIMMRFIFNLALKWEVPGVKKNPTINVALMPVNNKREFYLKPAQASVLYESVCRSENTMLKYIVPMLILTGARKREVLDAKWEDFDFERRLWRIPTTKLGKPRHVPLSDGVMDLLSTMPRNPKSDWVFANPKTGRPYGSLYGSWNTARNRAGLQGFRMHDLRHSFASLLINSGRSLYEVQKLLGHTQIITTQRYAHLAPETLLAASNAATQAVGEVMGVRTKTVVNEAMVDQAEQSGMEPPAISGALMQTDSFVAATTLPNVLENGEPRRFTSLKTNGSIYAPESFERKATVSLGLASPGLSNFSTYLDQGDKKAVRGPHSQSARIDKSLS